MDEPMQEYDDMDYEDTFIYPEDVDQEYDVGEPPMDDEEDDEVSAEIVLDEPDMLFDQHTGHVYALAVHPTDANILLSGGGDDVAMLWDSTTGTVKHVLKGHSDSVVAVGFNFDGTLAATGGYDGIVRVWSVESGAQVQALEGPSEEIEWFTWHSKGNVILAGSSDGTAWLWLATSGECMQVFAGHEGSVSCGTFNGSGKAALTGSVDGTVRMWNPKTGECTYVYRGHDFHEGPICSLVCHPNQPLFLSGSQDGTARLVHLQTKKVLAIMSHKREITSNEDMEEEIANSVECVAFAPNLNWCATGCLGGELRIWDLSNNQCRHICRHDEGIIKLQWHATEPSVATVCVDGTARWWDARNGMCLKKFNCHQDMIVDLLVIGSKIYTASEDNTVRRF